MSSNCPDELLEHFSKLRQFVDRQGKRAPHKPLLLLLALARLQQNDATDLAFKEIRKPLSRLLELYAPPTSRVRPRYPFWFLQFDSIWVVRDADQFVVTADRAPSSKSLIEFGRGGIRDDLRKAFLESKRCIVELAHQLLDAHFPESLHAEIAAEVGLELSISRFKRSRDPRFREWVLRAYGAECAVCGFQMHFKRSVFGIEAAHIRWHAHNGPDTVNNGLALCSLHHRAFDTGILGIRDDYRIVISQHLQGGASSREFMLPFSGMEIHRPHAMDLEPAKEHLEWHREKVFQDPARD